MALCGLLEAAADHAAEHVDADALALDFAAGLVLLVRRHAHDGTVDLPAADVRDELVEGFAAAQVQPLLQGVRGDGAEGLADLDGNADAHQLLEAGDVGSQVCVQVIGVEGRPELGVLGGLEEGGQLGELLHGLDEVGGLRGGLGLGSGRERLSVGGEKGEAEREGGGGENGEGLGQDVGDGVGLQEMRVKLVAMVHSVSDALAIGSISVNARECLGMAINACSIAVLRKFEDSQHPHT